MTLDEIKNAVENGRIVCYGNEGSIVVKDKWGQWFIVCIGNGYTIGLTWKDGHTMNGAEKDFYIA